MWYCLVDLLVSDPSFSVTFHMDACITNRQANTSIFCNRHLTILVRNWCLASLGEGNLFRGVSTKNSRTMTMMVSTSKSYNYWVVPKCWYSTDICTHLAQCTLSFNPSQSLKISPSLGCSPLIRSKTPEEIPRRSRNISMKGSNPIRKLAFLHLAELISLKLKLQGDDITDSPFTNIKREDIHHELEGLSKFPSRTIVI